MAKEHFRDWQPQRHTLKRLDHVHAIIAEYKAQGLTLNLRQVFYQFVARDLEENTQAKYQALKEMMIRAREAGLVDWNDLVDLGRELITYASWGSPEDGIGAVADQYVEDLWEDQPNRVEVLIEKSALVGVIDGVCREWQVPYLSMRGNNSITMIYESAKRYEEQIEQGLHPVVLVLCDHDPAGWFMDQTIRRKLSEYARHPIDVRRLALNLDQVTKYKLPENTLKEDDSRHAAYVRETGLEDGWELDALEPSVIVQLIRSEVEALVDHEAWQSAKYRAAANKAALGILVDRWDDVQSYLGGELEAR